MSAFIGLLPAFVSVMPEPVRSFYADHCIYLPAMLGWFFFSAMLSSYNKYIFGAGHYHFPCPLFMTSIHFLTQWAFAWAACAMFPVTLGTRRITSMSWEEWWMVSVPCGVATSADVGLSNLSLVRITITFYTMVKSSTPIFVLAWAYVFGIERITYPLVGVVLIIAAGEFLTVVGEVDFDRIGFFLCLGASVLSGMRWTLVQLKLRSLQPPITTTIATMRLLSPSMFKSLFILSLIIEKPWVKLKDFEDTEDVFKILGLGLIGAFLAIAMVLCEFYLILQANAIVLMIGGVIKEMTTILIGVTYFGDKLNRINVSGCFVVFSGVALYKLVHYLDALEKQSVVDLDGAEVDAVLEIVNDEGNNDNNDNNERHFSNGNGKSHPTMNRRNKSPGRNDSEYEKLPSSGDEHGRDGLMRSKSGGIELRHSRSKSDEDLSSDGMEVKAIV